jgi:hypothetical protein
MARNDGVFADMEGDCILFGDTTGELYRRRPDKSTTSDIFVVKLARRDGQHSVTLEKRRSGRHVAAGIFGFIFIVIILTCGYFYYFKIRRPRRRYKKDDDFVITDAVFRDDPDEVSGSDNPVPSMPISSYKDNDDGLTQRKNIEMSTVMPIESYSDEAQPIS